MPSNIFLVGPMGVGKSTIGRRLAAMLHKEFKDSDHEIIARTGVPIALIFDIEGEEGFRRRETAMIEELTEDNDIILATGGGAILSENNRAVLRRRGTVIYLYATPAQLFERTRHDKKRPLLQTADPQVKLAELLTVRDPLYREVADFVVQSGGRSINSLINEIFALLEPPQ